MIKLVCIERNTDASYNYKRYDGRTLTHQGLNQRVLDADEVETFRRGS